MRLALLTLLCLTACAPIVRRTLEQPNAAARRQGMIEKVVDNGQTRVRYFVGGEGPTVLLIHGFGGGGAGTWRPQIPALLEGHRVIVPDLLWFGNSFSSRTPSLQTQARAMFDVLDNEGAHQVDIVCVSYGGFVTLRMFQDQPQRIGKVLFSDTPGPFMTEAEEAELNARYGVSGAEEIFVPDEASDIQRLIDLTLAKPPKLPEWALNVVLRESAGRYPEQKRQLVQNVRTWRGKELNLPQAPLFVWGENDDVFPLVVGQRFAEATGGRLVVIEGARHGPSFEFPEIFNEAMLGFLDGE